MNAALSFLIVENIGLLRQASSLVEGITQEAFVQTRTGSHLRHILEFYECFLDGLTTSHIDYDARKRQAHLETDRQASLAKTRMLEARLDKSPFLKGDASLFVRIEDAAAQGLRDSFVLSSVGRELQTLRSHTVHHFAIIALTLKAANIAVDSSFGVAPSTLRHQQRSAA